MRPQVVEGDAVVFLGDSASTLIWGHASFPAEYRAAQTVVYGHWNNAVVDEHGWPTPSIVGNTIGIDTISHGVLTAIRMPDRTVSQSRRFRTALAG